MISLLDKWLLLGRVIADASLPPCAAGVAYVLLNHHNAETERCDPSRETVAAQLGISVKSVDRAMSALIDGRYFERKRRGYPLTNAYQPVTGESRQSDGTNLSTHLPTDRTDLSPHPESDRTILSKVTGQICPPNPSIEPVKESPAAPLLFPAIPAKPKPSKTPRRHPSLYKSESGCSIDNYRPDPEIMGAWAAEKTPLVPNPVAPETVDDIKDVWRRRGEKPKDFDATYRTYLRQRQKWAAEKANGAGGEHRTFQKSRAAI